MGKPVSERLMMMSRRVVKQAKRLHASIPSHTPPGRALRGQRVTWGRQCVALARGRQARLPAAPRPGRAKQAPHDARWHGTTAIPVRSAAATEAGRAADHGATHRASTWSALAPDD